MGQKDNQIQLGNPNDNIYKQSPTGNVFLFDGIPIAQLTWFGRLLNKLSYKATNAKGDQIPEELKHLLRIR